MLCLHNDGVGPPPRPQPLGPSGVPFRGDALYMYTSVDTSKSFLVYMSSQCNGACQRFVENVRSHMTPEKIQYIDGVSACLSLVGWISLLVTLHWWPPATDRVWQNTMIFTQDHEFTEAVGNMGMQLYATCANTTVLEKASVPESGAFVIFDLQAEWNGDDNKNENATLFTGTPVSVDRGHSYQPFFMLLWVLMCSVVFQTARCVRFRTAEQSRLSPSPYDYVPSSGPDFWRWYEYALTSPLQIIIIAGSFYARDMHLLLVLASLQGALVLVGYLLELQIEAVFVHKMSFGHLPGNDQLETHGLISAQNTHALTDTQLAYSTHPARQRIDTFKLVVLLSSSWTLHGVIWFVLLDQFMSVRRGTEDCRNDRGMPSVVTTVVIIQCLCFSLFGLVASGQALLLLCLRSVSPSYKENVWYTVSAWYSILSVVAKLTLEWGFIAIVSWNSMRQENKLDDT